MSMVRQPPAAQGNLTPASSREPRLSISVGIILVLGSLVFLAAGLALFAVFSPGVAHLVSLQWAGSPAAAVKVVGKNAAQFRLALGWDLWALVPGYTLGLLGACYLGLKVFLTRRTRGWARIGLAATIVAFACNVAQDALLLFALDHGLPGTWIFRAAQALSFGKFTVLLVAGAVGLAALSTAAGRLIAHSRVSGKWHKAIGLYDKKDRPFVIPPPPPEADMGSDDPPLPEPDYSWWQRHQDGADTHWAQGFALPPGTPTGGTGICVSGGGIRSATVSLGALQALQQAKILPVADHLVSVSGGGYTVGGLQLARMPHKDLPAGAGAGLPAQSDVFGPGSVEEDHLRRHSSYISADARQWAAALGVMFRGVASSFVLIGLTVTTAGLAIAAFFHAVPVLGDGTLGKLKPYFLAPAQGSPRYPAIPPGIWLAIGAAAALSVLGCLAYFLIPTKTRASRTGRRASRLLAWIIGLMVLLAAVGIALPALIWASSWLTWQLKPNGKVVATSGTLSLVISYFGALAATLWRKRTTLVTSGTGTAAKVPVRQVLPNSMIQLILMWLCLIILILAILLLGSWVATSGLDRSWWALVPPGVLAVIAIFLDQTAISLHPFYRQRLAGAFAVRRDKAGTCDVPVPEPYPYREATPLSTYARRPPQFPSVAFAATANIKGQDRTPSGRPAASYTFTSDYIGGPRVGWVRTDALEFIAGPRIAQDLTVEAAMAISGAAFASAMGAATRFYEVFLALSNARLGAWLPNPRHVALKKDHPDDWTIPGLPRIRRLSYFVREIFGIHPSRGRMLLCTDGGHFDNLGLLEVLRRRCERIFCIDSSGARPPLNDTLAGALTLAKEELGVDITFQDSPFDLVAGGWNLMKPATPFADLNDRLSKSAVIVGQIAYPPSGSQSANHRAANHQVAKPGTLIFAQAVLTDKMPYELLDFPQNDTYFPRDGTADQWFDVGQFDAYQQLGSVIGRCAAERAHECARPPRLLFGLLRKYS